MMMLIVNGRLWIFEVMWVLVMDLVVMYLFCVFVEVMLNLVSVMIFDFLLGFVVVVGFVV